MGYFHKHVEAVEDKYDEAVFVTTLVMKTT